MTRGAWLALVAAIPLGIAARAAAASDEIDTKLIPLPLYATLPNEGSTYGLLPVFLRVNRATGATHSIFAPSASWNKVVKVTGTFRFYRYFTDTRSLQLIASASLRVNRTLWFEYAELTRRAGAITTSVSTIGRQNVFYRFFGLGPFTTKQDESSYTRLLGRGYGRVGYNLREGLNLGAFLEVRGDEPRRTGVPGLPLAQDRYPDVPGMNGAAIAVQGLSVIYDTRLQREYSTSGFVTELAGSVSEGIANTSAFGRLVSHTRALWPETDWLAGAARLYVERVFGHDVPFMYQSTLGGELLLRGFTEGRFFDRGAWTADFEQRLRAFQTHLFGVVADWRTDVFVAVGQVFDAASDAFARVRVSGGVGFRAWVHPNVLGRIDVAYAGEGVQAYVVLGYPF